MFQVKSSDLFPALASSGLSLGTARVAVWRLTGALLKIRAVSEGSARAFPLFFVTSAKEIGPASPLKAYGRPLSSACWTIARSGFAACAAGVSSAAVAVSRRHETR